MNMRLRVRLLIVPEQKMDLYAFIRKIVRKLGEGCAHPDGVERGPVECWMCGGVPDMDVQEVSVFSDGHREFDDNPPVILLGRWDGPVSLDFLNDVSGPWRNIDLVNVKSGPSWVGNSYPVCFCGRGYPQRPLRGCLS